MLLRRNRASLVMVLLLVGSAHCLAATLIPQFVLGGGYEFVIIVANKSNTAETIEFRVFEGYNQPWSAPFAVNGQPHSGNVIRVSLARHSVKKLRLTGGQQWHSGYLSFEEKFEFPSLAKPITTQFFYEFRQNGKLIDSVGAPTGFTTWGTNALAFPVERTDRINTGFALAPWSPPGSDRIFSYRLRLFDHTGQQVGLKTLIFNGHTALFFDQVFPDIPDHFLGWLSVEALGPNFIFDHVVVSVIRQELTVDGFQLTNIPPDFGVPSQLPK